MTREKLKKLINFFCNIQTTRSKEEAFLKGVLFGSGGCKVRPKIDWELLKKIPDMIDIEREMQEMFDDIHHGNIVLAQQLLSELQKKPD